MRFKIKALSDARERERESKGRSVHIRYEDIISVDNLLEAWREFLRGKRKRKDVAEFSAHLTDHILQLYQELAAKTYRHGPYHAFKVNDPKPRDIHKAQVRDRLVHHAIYRVLYPHFDKKFIFDSYSCRRSKGTHRAINRFRTFAQVVSKNHTRTVWVLKCDIRKFFASIDHVVLEELLACEIRDQDIRWLLAQVIGSFNTAGRVGVGLPLGNLTSQLFVNIFMNAFDQFMKRDLKTRFYIRYADDFVVFHENKRYLENILPGISLFLQTQLKLSLHPDKVSIAAVASGVDFLGWVHFPHHRVLRPSTKRRISRRLRQFPTRESMESYIGFLSHGNAYCLIRRLLANN
jgi:RNA-directed DNA polymerase